MLVNLPFIPERGDKPREAGISMIMDRGLSIREAGNLISSAGHLVDMVKFGFGSAMVAFGVKEKIKLYQESGIRPFLGGTLFEAFIVRDKFDDFQRLLSSLGLDLVEVSDGEIALDHELKCEYIAQLSKDFTVLSEVGSKEARVVIPDKQWVEMMLKELNAGSWKVIAESRESGNVGIYQSDSSANSGLISSIIEQVPVDKVIWESPQRAQQVMFIKLLGSNVNLGNIAYNEVIVLETLRLGLRGDTFFQYLPDELKEKFGQ